MVIIIVHKLTLSSYTDPLVNRLGMWYCLLKPYFRYGWSSNVFRRSLHILLGNGDSPPNGVFAWHPKRPAILQDTIIFHTDSEYCNQFISDNSWMWYSYKAVSKMPKDSAKTGQCSWVASERYWDEKQPHSCTSDTNHFTRKVLYSWLLELGVVFYITDRVKGHLALSRKIHWEMAIKVSEDKNIAAKNFEGTFGQLSNYLKRLSYIKPQIINTN